MSKHRLFVGVSLPEGFTKELSALPGQFNYLYWNWTKPSNLHNTLCFIGSVSDEKISSIKTQLYEVGRSSFKMKVDKIVPVIRKRRVDMIWATFEQSPDFNNLSIDIHKTLSIPLEREPKPHITLCRVKALNTKMVGEEDFPSLQTKEIDVNGFLLYESVSDGKGPTYNVLDRW